MDDACDLQEGKGRTLLYILFNLRISDFSTPSILFSNHFTEISSLNALFLFPLALYFYPTRKRVDLHGLYRGLLCKLRSIRHFSVKNIVKETASKWLFTSWPWQVWQALLHALKLPTELLTAVGLPFLLETCPPSAVTGHSRPALLRCVDFLIFAPQPCCSSLCR